MTKAAPTCRSLVVVHEWEGVPSTHPITPSAEQRALRHDCWMLAVDDNVRVLDGAFAGFAGQVASVNPGGRSVVVNVRIFGRATPVEMRAESVEATEAVDSAGSSRPDPTAILDSE